MTEEGRVVEDEGEANPGEGAMEEDSEPLSEKVDILRSCSDGSRPDIVV